MTKPRLKVWHDPWHFLAAGHGLGALPVMPGTFGSITGLVYYWFLVAFGWQIYIAATVLATLFGVWLCEKVSKDLGVHDHGSIVWDEIVGILLTFLFVEPSVSNLIAGFLFFRLFDIWKPWPISVADKNVFGGLGIMLDDVLAAIPAWACLQLWGTLW